MRTIYGLGYTLKNKKHIFGYMGGWNGNGEVIPILIVKEDGSILLYNEPSSLKKAKQWIANTQTEATEKGYPDHDKAQVDYLCQELEEKVNQASQLNKSVTKNAITDLLKVDFD